MDILRKTSCLHPAINGQSRWNCLVIEQFFLFHSWENHKCCWKGLTCHVCLLRGLFCTSKNFEIFLTVLKIVIILFGTQGENNMTIWSQMISLKNSLDQPKNEQHPHKIISTDIPKKGKKINFTEEWINWNHEYGKKNSCNILHHLLWVKLIGNHQWIVRRQKSSTGYFCYFLTTCHTSQKNITMGRNEKRKRISSMPKKQAKLQIKEKKILIFTLNEMGNGRIVMAWKEY